MKCPHFSKVNFERIKQVKNDEGTFEDEHIQQMNCSIFSIESLSEQIYNVPEQSIQPLNSFKNKISNYKYTFNNSNTRQQQIRQITNVKMPKQMNIKQMMCNSENNYPTKASVNSISRRQYEFDSYKQKNQENQEQSQIPSEHDHSGNRKNLHILISKTSMMTHDSFQIFNGVVFLSQKAQNPFQCEIKEDVIKILKQQKIKYFIELQKVKVSLQQLSNNQKGIKISLKCKTKTDSIKIYFISQFQKQIFVQVYSTSLIKIKQQRRIKEALDNDKQNFSYKNNFHNDDQPQEQSQIFNEKNQLNQQQSQSISSLSITSYEGDSLVFQTQRMFFSQVKQTGNTFDVLLFKNKSLMSKVQRIFTNSDYDHTALLLRTANNDLLMLEATSNSGVAIYTFNSLMKIDKNKYFSRIGLRRYTGDKNSTKISRLQNFIRKTVGKKYKFDPMYLIKSQANQQKQTFFCSQLVAEALQDVGILSNHFPSFKYLPKHFAQQNLNNQIIDGRFSDVIILQ